MGSVTAEIITNDLSVNELKINQLEKNEVNSVDHIDNTFLSGHHDTTKPILGGYRIHKFAHSDASIYTNINFRFINTTFTPVKILPNSTLKLFVDVPLRNDSSAWGGAYVEILYKINNDNYISLGNSGFDGVMTNGLSSILTYNKSFIITPTSAPTTESYYLNFTMRIRAYDNTTDTTPLYLNGNRDINQTGSGGSAYQNSTHEPLDHFHTTFILYEYNDMRLFNNG